MVSLMNEVRTKTTRGMTSDQLAALKSKVRSKFAAIEESTRVNRFSLRHLPPPSREAYKMLKEFRSYTGRRFNPWMSVVTSSLTDEEIADVAAYVSTLR